jgi:hypothetical protein
MTIRILNPIGIAESEADGAAAMAQLPPRRSRVRSLNGAVLGVLTNAFRGYDLPGAVADRIAQRVELADLVRHVKPSISRPAGPEVTGQLADEVDAVIVGICA